MPYRFWILTKDIFLMLYDVVLHNAFQSSYV